MDGGLMLAIETSSPRGSIALGSAGGPPAARFLTTGRRHTGQLLPAIRDLLGEAGAKPADVAVVCFSQGPGSFTGLRVAATIARMWQSATGARVVGVSTLEVIAANALSLSPSPSPIVAMIDARQGRLFGAVLELCGDGRYQMTEPAGLHVAADWLANLPRPCAVLGDAAGVHAAVLVELGHHVLPPELWLPDARALLAIGRRLADAGRFCEAARIVPCYIQPPECEEVFERRRAEARARRGQPGTETT